MTEHSNKGALSFIRILHFEILEIFPMKFIAPLKKGREKLSVKNSESQKRAPLYFISRYYLAFCGCVSAFKYLQNSKNKNYYSCGDTEG
jgi:hypothetical protein